MVRLLLLTLVFSRQTLAEPVGEFIPGFAIALQHETVSNKVNQSPNLADGGFATEVSKPRFQSEGLLLSYGSDRTTRYQFSLVQRQLNSLRDSFSINEVSAAVTRRFHPRKSSQYSLDLSLEARVNRASEIYKNSYTSYAGKLITDVRMVEPRDARMSVHADLLVGLSNRLYMTLAVSGGLSQTRQHSVVGSARLDNNCRYAFNATAQGGSVRLLEPCGSLISFEQRYPSNATLNDRLGFSVSDDLAYRDFFFGPHVAMHWQQGAWSLGAGYEFRQYFRPSLDHRIRLSGETPVTRSHSAFASISVGVSRHWSVDARALYQHSAFLDDIPFLYSALTQERFRGNGVIRYGLSITRYFH